MPLALLLDIDGTLLDTFDQLLAAQNGALAALGDPPLLADELRPLVGIPVSTQMAILRGMSGPKVAALTEDYYRRFEGSVRRGVRLYPGVAGTLEKLKDRPIGTMTTRRQAVAELMLQTAGIAQYFRAIVGGDQVAHAKPEPDIPRFAAHALGLPPSECVVVGDAPVDILAGNAAGAWTIAAAYGYGRRAELLAANPRAILETFEDLPRTLADLEGRANP